MLLLSNMEGQMDGLPTKTINILDKSVNVIEGFTEMKKIKGIFNENTKVEKTNDGFRIETKLIDGIEEGGQSIEIKTSPVLKVDKLGIDVDALEVQQLKINGVDILEDFDKIYLEIRPIVLGKADTFSSLELQVYKQHHPLMIAALHGQGTMAIKKEKIFTTSFKDADDLVGLLHEQGHCDDKNELTPEQIEMVKYLGVVYKMEHKVNIDRERAVKGWEQVVLMETYANNNALKTISEISKKVSIFPKDEKTGFMRFRKSREIALMSYINMSNGWYKEQVLSEKIQELSSI